MLIGVPKEIKPQENRVGLSADSVKTLVSEGNRVIIETGAGIGSGFTDADYSSVGASICHSSDVQFVKGLHTLFEVLVGLVFIYSVSSHVLRSVHVLFDSSVFRRLIYCESEHSSNGLQDSLTLSKYSLVCVHSRHEPSLTKE